MRPHAGQGTDRGLADFPTPPGLAREICDVVAGLRPAPATLIEPTCGSGNLLAAALERFPTIRRVVAAEVNAAHVRRLRRRFPGLARDRRLRVLEGSFFSRDWEDALRGLPEPWLVLGNPPWATHSGLAAAGSRNLPRKRNVHGLRGYDARTGKSNFDLAEPILLRLFERIRNRRGAIAILCKTSAARRALRAAWEAGGAPGRVELFRIDARRCFGASVDAGLLLCRFPGRGRAAPRVRVHSRLERSAAFSETWGMIGGRWVRRLDDYRELAGLARTAHPGHAAGARGGSPLWRSGIKHDCAPVMELRAEGRFLRNGLGEIVDLEETYLYPMRKGSDLFRPEGTGTDRRMLVPQRSLGEETARIAAAAPRTWAYLQAHGDRLDRRSSSIYRNRPRFAIFGVGRYSFAPWKVAVSGFAKTLRFVVVGPSRRRPVVFDDTVYFLACRSREEAAALARRLESPRARRFLESMIFWESKRPVTKEILDRLDPAGLDAPETPSDLRGVPVHASLLHSCPPPSKRGAPATLDSRRA